jgi:pyridoxal phosphate enzyme (YggS family)
MGALHENLKRLKERLHDAERASSRPLGSVQLLPVTKSADLRLTLELARAGELELAESRVSGLEEKASHLADEGVEVHWHFIGHLQRNKARRVLKIAQVIHSVDSLRLIESLARIARDEKLRPAIYLEVLLSGEKEKSGLDPEEINAALTAVAKAGCFALMGIMVMGPRDSARTKEVFSQAETLAQTLQAAHPEAFDGGLCRLSMGMSADLELAVQAGSSLVRVGSALFEGVNPKSTSRNSQEGAA